MPDFTLSRETTLDRAKATVNTSADDLTVTALVPVSRDSVLTASGAKLATTGSDGTATFEVGQYLYYRVGDAVNRDAGA